MPTLRHRLAFGAVALVLLAAVVASAVVVSQSIETLGRSVVTAERPAEVSRTLIRLNLAVVDAETAQRGYLLTGEAEYLGPYENVRARTDSLLTRLDTLVSWNPLQVRRMTGLRASIQNKLDEMEEVLVLDRAGDRAAALDVVKTEKGARLMTDIRSRIDAMLAEAARVSTFWGGRFEAARHRALLATLLTNGILILLLVVAGLLLRRLLRLRERAAEALQTANGELRRVVAEREQALVRVHAMQAQLVHQEKLAGLGRLTAGVAHELKNPLNFVTNFAEIASELTVEALADLDAGRGAEARTTLADVRLNLTRIRDNADRADEIVRTMLVHARGVSGSREPVDLESLLATAVQQAMGTEAPAEVTVDVDLSGETLVGIPSALGRMFLNLVENAVHATRERASVSALEYAPCVDIRARRGTSLAGHAVATVTVADNGAGIPEALLPRIFEPFYTTKTPGQGTGLGLSLAHDIAVGHGGALTAGQAAEGGALFTVTLPLEDSRDEQG